jgi:hypothetical protein
MEHYQKGKEKRQVAPAIVGFERGNAQVMPTVVDHEMRPRLVPGVQGGGCTS